MKRTMALDVGSKRIGVAISDPLGITAQPLTTISRHKGKDIQEIALLVAQYAVQEIVVGLPKDMKGTYTKSAEDALEFKKELESALTIPVKVWDERLSTMAMERFLIEQDVSRQKRKQVIDKMAAVYILQGYMSSQQSKGNNEKN